MNILTKRKDGGPDSPVDAYFLFEIKWLGSVALLKFNKGMRESYHSHAFHALTWFIKGDMVEEKLEGVVTKYTRSFIPKITKRNNIHRVRAYKNSWCITIRGPWQKNWSEYNPVNNTYTELTHGRKIISQLNGVNNG